MTDAPDTLPFDLRTQRALCYTIASVGSGEFHRELVSFVTGIVVHTSRDDDPSKSASRQIFHQV